MPDEWNQLLRGVEDVEPPTDLRGRVEARRSIARSPATPKAARLSGMGRWVLAAVGVVVLVLALAFAAHARQAAPNPRPATNPTANLFTRARGWIAVGGHTITAFDPEHPDRSVVLSHSPGWPLAWSRDGTELLVSRVGGLAVLRSDGAEIRLTSLTAGGGSFTPDGKSVIYESDVDALSLYKVSVNGGTPVELASGAMAFGYALSDQTQGGQLSPDGTTVAFVGYHNHFARNIWLINSDGTNQRKLVAYSEIRALSGKTDIQQVFPLAWSPDGSRLLILGDDATHNGDCLNFVVNADGTGLRRITSTSTCLRHAAWSPDGHSIAGVRRGSVVAMNPDGTNIHLLHARIPGMWPSIAWNPVEPTT